MSVFSHLDEKGCVRMVDVGSKDITVRQAQAQAVVRMRPETLAMIMEKRAAKGNVLECARIAGIMAAKKTPELIPMCHPLEISHVSLDFKPLPEQDSILILATAACAGRTGVEMEAMTAAAVAGLTIYDMCKSVDRAMELDQIRLLFKCGGKSGQYRRETDS